MQKRLLICLTFFNRRHGIVIWVFKDVINQIWLFTSEDQPLTSPSERRDSVLNRAPLSQFVREDRELTVPRALSLELDQLISPLIHVCEWSLWIKDVFHVLNKMWHHIQKETCFIKLSLLYKLLKSLLLTGYQQICHWFLSFVIGKRLCETPLLIFLPSLIFVCFCLNRIKTNFQFYPCDQDHRQTFAYFIVDPLKRHVSILYHRFGSGVFT